MPGRHKASGSRPITSDNASIHICQTPRPLRPLAIHNPTLVISAARSAGGASPASIAKLQAARHASHQGATLKRQSAGRRRRRTPKLTTSTRLAISPTCSPDTTARCVNPVAFKDSQSSRVSAEARPSVSAASQRQGECAHWMSSLRPPQPCQSRCSAARRNAATPRGGASRCAWAGSRTYPVATIPSRHHQLTRSKLCSASGLLAACGGTSLAISRHRSPACQGTRRGEADDSEAARRGQ